MDDRDSFRVLWLALSLSLAGCNVDHGPAELGTIDVNAGTPNAFHGEIELVRYVSVYGSGPSAMVRASEPGGRWVMLIDPVAEDSFSLVVCAGETPDRMDIDEVPMSSSCWIDRDDPDIRSCTTFVQGRWFRYAYRIDRAAIPPDDQLPIWPDELAEAE